MINSLEAYEVELGDSAESNLDSIRFTIVAPLAAEAIWSALSNVLAKLLTLSPPIPLSLYTLSYWSNLPF